MNLSAEQRQSFRDGVAIASSRSDVRDAVENIYRALQDAIELRKPVCVTSGRCCRFDEFGHQLFVTTMEMGAFVAQLEQWHDSTEHVAGSTAAAGGCPFQVGKLCGVHQIRPFGCRVFFCDETATDWQRNQYSRFHEEFKRLHEQCQIPYFYVEWRLALQILGIPEGSDRAHVISPPRL